MSFFVEGVGRMPRRCAATNIFQMLIAECFLLFVNLTNFFSALNCVFPFPAISFCFHSRPNVGFPSVAFLYFMPFVVFGSFIVFRYYHSFFYDELSFFSVRYRFSFEEALDCFVGFSLECLK